MRFQSRTSLYLAAVPYFAGLSCITGIEIHGLQLQGYAWLLFFVVGVLVISITPTSRTARFPWKLWLPWILYVGLSLLLGSMLIRWNFQAFIQILTPFIVGAIASYSVRDDDQWKRLQRGFVHGLIIISCAFVYFSFGPSVHGGMTVALGESGQIGFGARPAGMTLAIIGCILLANVQKSRMGSVLGWSLCVVIAVLSGSRMASAVLLFVAVFSPLYRRMWTRLVALTVVCLLGLIIFYTPIMQGRFFYSGEGRLSDIRTEDFADQSRFALWEATLKGAQNHIILGAGVGEACIFISERFDIGQVHNDYLRILFEFGLVGSVLYVCAVISQLASLRKLMRIESGEKRTAATAGYLGMVTWLCFSVTDNPLVYNLFFTHPLFAIMGAAYGLAGGEREARSSPVVAVERGEG